MTVEEAKARLREALATGEVPARKVALAESALANDAPGDDADWTLLVETLLAKPKPPDPPPAELLELIRAYGRSRG